MVLAAALSTLLGTTAAVWAQSPVAVPVKLVVGYAAGGPVDAAARAFAPVLSRELGQPVVVDNRPGAGGALAGQQVVKALPNGLELFFAASPTMTISPHVLKAMTFDPLKDLMPIAPILTYANVLVVSQGQSFKTVPDLVAHAKANPGRLSFGSAGMGASNHLSGELFAQRAGIALTHVPYRGNAPAMTDVMGGQLAMMFDIVGGAKGHIDSGRVKALAVTSKERNPALPDTPSLAELGFKDFDVGGWYGLYAPLGLSKEVAQRLSAAVSKAQNDPDLASRWKEQGYVMWTGTGSELEARMRQEHAMWGEVTKTVKFD
ncbi:MAG: tripartite tricarboxylate transporter substrate binding protein [Serpentinimonas sp.]|nr:tripartite tricarboxylate transporter substrate binding protein [Serpentinimonas sp.]